MAKHTTPYMREKRTSTTHDIKSLEELEKLARSMDSKWRLPLLNIPIGWDGILGLVPGIGDTITSFISFYIVREAHRLGVPWWNKTRMTWNIFLDWLVGFIPFFGDIFDIGWKANTKNVALIREHLVKCR